MRNHASILWKSGKSSTLAYIATIAFTGKSYVIKHTDVGRKEMNGVFSSENSEKEIRISIERNPKSPEHADVGELKQRMRA